MSKQKDQSLVLTAWTRWFSYFPDIGAIQVVGDTYTELREKLRNLIAISYVGVNIDISCIFIKCKKKLIF